MKTIDAEVMICSEGFTQLEWNGSSLHSAETKVIIDCVECVEKKVLRGTIGREGGAK